MVVNGRGVQVESGANITDGPSRGDVSMLELCAVEIML